MKEKYGNSFGGSKESMKLATFTPWIRVDEFYPGGAYVKAGLNHGISNSATHVGQKIPLGTKVYMNGLGSKPYFNTSTNGGTTPDAEKCTLVGFTYEDAYVGEDGCSLTIVTRGTINKNLVEESSDNMQSAHDSSGLVGGITIV